MHTIKCPKCRFNAAAFEKIDAQGAHYTCPNCEHGWNDPTVKVNDFYVVEEEPGYFAQDSTKAPAPGE
jgi:rubredoxin